MQRKKARQRRGDGRKRGARSRVRGAVIARTGRPGRAAPSGPPPHQGLPPDTGLAPDEEVPATGSAGLDKEAPSTGSAGLDKGVQVPVGGPAPDGTAAGPLGDAPRDRGRPPGGEAPPEAPEQAPQEAPGQTPGEAPRQEAAPDDAAPPGEVPPVQGLTTAEQVELARLRAELAELRAQVVAESPRRRTHRGLAVRRFLAAFLVAVAGFGAVASVVGLWADRTTFDTDRWVATVGPLPEHPEINTAMATYLTDEVFSSLNVEQRLKSALPTEVAFLAGPVTSAVRDYVRSTVQKFMATEQFRDLWESTNRFAHAQIVAVLEGRSKAVYIQGDKVTLNLLPVVNNLLVSLEKELPTMFGKRLQLPTLTSGEIPAGLRSQIEQALGVTLPSDFAQIELFESDRLSALQRAVVIFQRSVDLLIVGTILIFGLALLAAPSRRRTLLQFGIWLVVATVTLISVLRIAQDQVLQQIPVTLYREAAEVAMRQVFTTLRQQAMWLLWLGGVIAVVSYLVGPGRGAVAVRRYTVRGSRAAWSFTSTSTVSVARSGSLRTFAATYTDALRVGGVVLAVIVALLLSSWTGLIVVAFLLALFEVGVWLLARSGGPPPPRPPRPAPA